MEDSLKPPPPGPLTHHLYQAGYWLENAAHGEHSTHVTHAALELRYAIERLAVHFWAQLDLGASYELELRRVDSFKALEKRIYELAGHQREIDKTFEFFNLLLQALGVERALTPPRIGLLSKYWHLCSEVCHIGWVLAAGRDAGLAHTTFTQLTEAWEALRAMAESSSGLPRFDDPIGKELRDRFVRGEMSAAQLQGWIKEQGLYSQVITPNEEPFILGTPVPPGGA